MRPVVGLGDAVKVEAKTEAIPLGAETYSILFFAGVDAFGLK